MPKIYEKFHKQYNLNLERTYLVREKEKPFIELGELWVESLKLMSSAYFNFDEKLQLKCTSTCSFVMRVFVHLCRSTSFFFFIYLTYKLQSNTHRCHRIRFKFSFAQIVVFLRSIFYRCWYVSISKSFRHILLHCLYHTDRMHPCAKRYFECLSSLCECVERCSSWHQILFFP